MEGDRSSKSEIGEDWFRATLSAARAGDLLAQDELRIEASRIAEAEIKKYSVGIEDAAQEVALLMQHKLLQFQGDEYSQFKSWIRVITKHAFHKEVSQRENQNQQLSDFESALQKLGNLDLNTPSKEARAREWQQRLTNALNELSETERQVVMLRLQDIAFTKIASNLQLTNEMAARRIYDKCLEKLKKLVVDEGLSSSEHLSDAL